MSGLAENILDNALQLDLAYKNDCHLMVVFIMRNNE
jgi:hypothetical protein